MRDSVKALFEELFVRHPRLACCKADIADLFEACAACYRGGNTLFICGNGGSAADSEHIVGELMKSFRKIRALPEGIAEGLAAYGEEGVRVANGLEGGLPAVALTSHLSLSTAFANDSEPALTFAQQLLQLGKAGDALICISTSGSSRNCVYAAMVGKVKGLTVLSLTGEKEGRLNELSSVTVRVPERETFKVQELHLPVYHALCAMLEEEFFPDGAVR